MPANGLVVRAPGSGGQRVELPEVLLAHAQERLDGEDASRPDARLQIFQFFEFGARLLAGLVHDPLFAHHQEAIGAYRQFGVQSQVAEHVGDDSTLELLF